MPLILIEVSIAELTDHGVIGRASSPSAMASSSNLKIMVSFYVRVMQPLPEPDRTFMLELDSLQTIGDVIDVVASRFKVDKERIWVPHAGRYLTRNMNLEQARIQKQCTLNVLIKEATDGHVSSRTRSRKSAPN